MFFPDLHNSRNRLSPACKQPSPVHPLGRLGDSCRNKLLQDIMCQMWDPPSLVTVKVQGLSYIYALSILKTAANNKQVTHAKHYVAV